VFFTTGGSDAVDTAGKLARRYWQLRGEPHRTVLVARSEAYHGMNAYGTSLAGIIPNKEGWGPLVTDVLHVPHDDPEALEQVLAEHGDRIAAFIGEPVIGAGGVIPPVPGYWERVQRACAVRDVLLIADEVITGYGRTGPWFASERYDIRPDLVTSAKGLTSGFRLPPARGRAVRPACPRRAVGRDGRPVPPRLHLLRPRRGLRGGPGQPRHH
jgi:putrescine aminotransferase